MQKWWIFLLMLFLCMLTNPLPGEAKSRNYYRTFEVIDTTENGLTLQDSDGNIIEVQKDPGSYKVGYKVRYDSVRKRLRPYRWQDYEVTAVSDSGITLEHKTGDIISVSGNYSRQYKVGDRVRYDAIGNKLQPDENATEWKQYTVIAAAIDQVTIRDNLGEVIVLHMDNNLYKERRGVYIPQYEVGDLVRYDVKNNKLKKQVRRTYDWQEYTIKEATQQRLLLVNDDNEELDIENIYGTKYNPGDRVKYDRLNNLLKKVR